jgi:hypothetical protein
VNEIDVTDDGEVLISSGGKKIIHFFLPESERLELVLKLLESVKEKPAKNGGQVVSFQGREKTD